MADELKRDQDPKNPGTEWSREAGREKGLRRPPEKPGLVLLTTPEWWVMWFCISELCKNLCDKT